MTETIFKIIFQLLTVSITAASWVVMRVGRWTYDRLRPPPVYVQGYGGPDYQPKRETFDELVARHKTSKPAAKTAASPAVDDQSLVLRKGSETVDLSKIGAQEVVKAASRVITVDIAAQTGLPIAVGWIYLYEDKRKARRLVKFTQYHLAKSVCGKDETRYFFSDVDYDPAKGTKDITVGLVKDIETLLNRKGQSGKFGPIQATPPKEKVSPKAAATTGAIANPSSSIQAAQPVVNAPAPAVAHQAVSHADVAPIVDMPIGPVSRSVKGREYMGVVVSASRTNKSGPKGPYQTFCLTLNDGEKEVPLNGTEIERQVRDMGIRVGEKIKVVDMGRAPVNVAEGEAPRYKNLYQITRLHEGRN